MALELIVDIRHVKERVPDLTFSTSLTIKQGESDRKDWRYPKSAELPPAVTAQAVYFPRNDIRRRAIVLGFEYPLSHAVYVTLEDVFRGNANFRVEKYGEFDSLHWYRIEVTDSSVKINLSS